MSAAPPVPQNPENVPHDFICSLCRELSTNPVETPCGHLFCRNCIFESLQHREECPIDRQPLEVGGLREVSGALRRVHEGIPVRCPNETCSWTGVMGDYNVHSQRCETSAESRIIADLRQEIQSKEVIIREKDERFRSQEEAIQEMQSKIDELSETIRSSSRNTGMTLDENYRYDRTRVKELSLLICSFLEDMPRNIDRNRIYNCVKQCNDDLCRKWADNPKYYSLDMNMLINICIASNWFSDKQLGNLKEWSRNEQLGL